MTFIKGQSGNPSGPGKGYKQKKTLEKEERRRIFDEELTKVFKGTIKKARPEYLLDQFLGKAKETIELEGKVTVSFDE